MSAITRSRSPLRSATRALLLLAALVAPAAAAADARAGDPPQAPQVSPAPQAPQVAPADARALPLRARPKWSTIPRATIPALPSHDAAPAALSASEQVSGFTVESNDTAGSPRVRAFVDTTLARRSCLAGDVDFSTEADPTLRDRTTLAHLRLGVVTALRAERLLVDGDGPALEITDLWIDPRSRGARVIGTTRMALGTLARGPRGTNVYGYRDAADQLWVVLPMAANVTGVDGEGQRTFAACGHARLSAGQSGAQVALPWPAQPAQPPPPPVDARGMPMPRELLVTVAASKTSHDREPVVSVVMALTPERVAFEAVD